LASGEGLGERWRCGYRLKRQVYGARYTRGRVRTIIDSGCETGWTRGRAFKVARSVAKVKERQWWACSEQVRHSLGAGIKSKERNGSSNGRDAAKEGGRMRDDVARESGWLPKEQTKTVLRAPGRVGSGFMGVTGRESQ
jgi:hypothetical protein